MAVQTFSCPACKGGEFRSLPGPDGKAFCPWCGDAVTGGTASSAAEPVPAAAPPPAAAPVPPPSPASDPELRDRVTTLQRRSEHAEAELQRELEKKETIKRAVGAEMGRLSQQLAEAKAQLAKEAAAASDLPRLKAELDEARAKAAELAGALAAADAKEKARAALQADLEAARKESRGHQDAVETARHQAEQLKAELARLKASSEAEIKGLWKSVQAAEDRLKAQEAAEAGKLKALKDSGAEQLKSLKAADVELRELKPLWEKERAAQRSRESALRAEIEKRDQRIKELQMLVKTLGERLNDLTSRPR